MALAVPIGAICWCDIKESISDKFGNKSRKTRIFGGGICQKTRINRALKNPDKIEKGVEVVGRSLPDCGLQRAPWPPHAGTQASASKPACSPALQDWVDEANEVFNGFIVTRDNLPQNKYGYNQLYEKINKRLDFNMINTIKDLKGGKRRLYAYDLGLIHEKEVYEWFSDLVNRQNNTGAGLISPEGKEIIAQNGRFCNKKGKRSIHIRNAFKEGIGEITDVILLTLTVHENEILENMPDNTNLLPVQYATVKIGSWISRFLRDLRKYQERHSIPWEYVGYTVEFQEGDEKVHGRNPLKMHNGYAHAHLIFRGRWIGDIQKIASIWGHSELQGVDYMDRRKYERELISKGKLRAGHHVSGIRLVNYVTAYVSKCSKAIVVKDGDIYVHKGYAWLAFSGGRMYNVTREYKREKEEKNPDKSEVWKYEGMRVL